ncbi:hypothetical protein LINPERPRIM_LOCUS4046 [Linum perenne]|jgi:hypothetical protein
MYS